MWMRSPRRTEASRRCIQAASTLMPRTYALFALFLRRFCLLLWPIWLFVVRRPSWSRQNPFTAYVAWHISQVREVRLGRVTFRRPHHSVVLENQPAIGPSNSNLPEFDDHSLVIYRTKWSLTMARTSLCSREAKTITRTFPENRQFL